MPTLQELAALWCIRTELEGWRCGTVLRTGEDEIGGYLGSLTSDLWQQ